MSFFMDLAQVGCRMGIFSIALSLAEGYQKGLKSPKIAQDPCLCTRLTWLCVGSSTLMSKQPSLIVSGLIWCPGWYSRSSIVTS